jgi:AcrR family transcriptional regulator
MERVTRKQREVVQREGQFLDIARQILLQEGYHRLTMARVAGAAGYAKGTIYLHFSCKEDMIVALVTRSLERRLAMMERAAEFRGNPRERMVAVGEAVELFTRLYPDDLRLFYIGNTEAIMQKAAEPALFNMKRCSQRTFNVLLGIIRDAVACGDLILTGGGTPEALAYGFRAIMEGGYATAWSYMPPKDMGIDDPLTVSKNLCHVLGDGYGWRPLSSEQDYEVTRRRVWKEVFPEETRRFAI